MIQRFSSRRHHLDATFLNVRLQGAQAYDRVAGYFSSSILEVAGEALESVVGPIRMICNSELDERDVITARAAKNGIRQEWCASEPEKLDGAAKGRFTRLHHFLTTKKLMVRVLPASKFGLVHGKAGVITLASGAKTAFIGSTNETHNAWKLNYELVWEDDGPDSVQWVQEEFDALWNHPLAVELADFVIDDLQRLATRTVVPAVEVWRQEPDEAVPVIETPVYRREYGLWAHQKYFVKQAFDAHRSPSCARYVLADMVGLGKTIQLGLSALLMALYGDQPVLVLAPKTLLWQWQEELRNLLNAPSAVWDGKRWVDENGIEHPAFGPEGIKKCPRKIGIVSHGLVKRRSEAAPFLLERKYECVIVDEAHNARRKNLGPRTEDEKADPNNLLAFLYEISPKTKSMLLATATPVQLHPIEAWDLLDVLSRGSDAVLGNPYSEWRNPRRAIGVVLGRDQISADEAWNWIRNPLPPASEGKDFELLRRALKLPDSEAVAAGDRRQQLGPPDLERLKRVARDFAQNHNPFIRHIIRRTRDYLERTLDPETNEPYLKPVKVELHGEGDDEAIPLPPYLQEAYEHAEEFCKLLGARVKGSGFLKTLLLRRMGSSIRAGLLTAEKMLAEWRLIDGPPQPQITVMDVTPEAEVRDEEEMEETDETEDGELPSESKTLTKEESVQLTAFVHALRANQERDPKYHAVKRCLSEMAWLEQGCIIFSQFFASVWWLAEQLAKDYSGLPIGVYAGGVRSGIMRDGVFTKAPRETIKRLVRTGELKVLLGTEAASEGLNLQTLGTLINLDLPWNPTRLEQRKGRIQRIGQVRDVVHVYNMRYAGSVEDRVHHLLSARLHNIHQLFGQLPDVLEDVWVEVALGRIENAKRIIDKVPDRHPFETRYHEIKSIPWESCAKVLDAGAVSGKLLVPW